MRRPSRESLEGVCAVCCVCAARVEMPADHFAEN